MDSNESITLIKIFISSVVVQGTTEKYYTSTIDPDPTTVVQ